LANDQPLEKLSCHFGPDANREGDTTNVQIWWDVNVWKIILAEKWQEESVIEEFLQHQPK